MVNNGNRTVAIVDFHMGNLFSVKRACEQVGLNPLITCQKNDIFASDGIILPGVGAFGEAMQHLQDMDLIDVIKACIDQGKPFLGICLGMQLLMSESEEFGRHRGLDIISGTVTRFPTVLPGNKKIKVPHVGWNSIFRINSVFYSSQDISLDRGLCDGEYMYFVHSYYVQPDNPDVRLFNSRYEDIEYCSGIQWKNVSAVQFHPEKSAEKGIQIYQNWAEMI